MRPVIAMTTAGTEEEAARLAKLFVGERLAACVQIIPKIRSVYEWDGKLCDEQEYLLFIKTGEEKIDVLKDAVKKNHSYDVPEFLVIPATDGLEHYLQWMGKALASPE